MYMKNVMYKIIMGCYIVAALVLVTACNDNLDIQQLEKETFRLYYTSASTDQQTIDIYIIDSFGQMQQLTLSFNNDNSEEGTETITP